MHKSVMTWYTKNLKVINFEVRDRLIDSKKAGDTLHVWTLQFS